MVKYCKNAILAYPPPRHDPKYCIFSPMTTGWDTQNVKSWEWKHNCSLKYCPKYEGHWQGIEAKYRAICYG